MGSCDTAYEEGVILLSRDGFLEIVCPGFENKIYAKSQPRLEKRSG
jgi:hypothetical protein